MHVAEFLDPLCRRTDVEVIVPRLPNTSGAPGLAGFETRAKPPLFPWQAPRESQLQSLDCGSQRALLGLADQEVNVLRHYNVPDDHALVAPAYIFQHFEEQLAAVCVR